MCVWPDVGNAVRKLHLHSNHSQLEQRRLLPDWKRLFKKDPRLEGPQLQLAHQIHLQDTFRRGSALQLPAPCCSMWVPCSTVAPTAVPARCPVLPAGGAALLLMCALLVTGTLPCCSEAPLSVHVLLMKLRCSFSNPAYQCARQLLSTTCVYGAAGAQAMLSALQACPPPTRPCTATAAAACATACPPAQPRTQLLPATASARAAGCGCLVLLRSQAWWRARWG